MNGGGTAPTTSFVRVATTNIQYSGNADRTMPKISTTYVSGLACQSRAEPATASREPRRITAFMSAPLERRRMIRKLSREKSRISRNSIQATADP